MKLKASLFWLLGSLVTPVAFGVPLTSDAVLALVGTELSAKLNLDGELQLEFTRPWTPPSGDAQQWTIKLLDCSAMASASMAVRFRILADGVATPMTYDGVTVLKAALWRDGWAARNTTAVGAKFDPVELDARRVDVFRDRDAFVLPADTSLNFVFNRPVSAGRIIGRRDVGLRPLVVKGAVVEVRAASGPIVVTLKAQAIDGGGLGEKITLRNLESKKIFTAVITDENRANVSL